MSSVAPAALVGCYTYTYVASMPAPGARVALDLTDVGRVQLADHIGPEVLRIEGWLVSTSDSEFTLRVERTIGIRGGTVPWNGEQVTIRTSYVGLERVKQFSAQRTVVLAGAVAAGFVGLIAGRSLIGGSQGGSDGPAGPPPVSN